jgi:hypothetical protein
MLKIVIGLVLLGHGIGHSMGLLQIFKVATISPGWNGESWLLTGVAGPTITQVLGAIVWIGAMLGFIALGGVAVGWLPAAWWPTLAVGSSVLSLAGLLLFPTAFPTFSSIGALIVDISVLVAVVWLHWAPSDLAA